MGHYAKVQNNIVTRTIVAEAKFFENFVDTSPGQWIKTSYNILGGVYYDPETKQPAEDQSIIKYDEGRQRKNYAGVNYIYDKSLDAFIPPRPFDSWILNENTCLWEPPIARPDDDNDYRWDEEIVNWVKIAETDQS